MFNRFRFALFVFSLVSIALSTAAADPIRIGYSFNEGTNQSGGATDFYGVLNGAWNGTWAPPPDGGSTYFRPGFSGEEGDFSITSGGNRVRVNVNSILGETWGSFTIEAHFTIGEATSFRRMVDIDGFGIALQKNGANQLRTSLGRDQNGDIIQTGALSEGQWYHAAVVYNADAGTVSLYLDGNLIGAGPANAWTTPTDLYIGAGRTGGSTWNGTIDDFRLTSAVLTPDEFLRDGFGIDMTEPLPPADPLPDAAELQLFWTELDLGEIHTGRADGSGRATLVSGLNRPIGIQIDQEAGSIYWAEDGVPGEIGNGRIGRSALDGSGLTILYAATEGDIGLDNPQHIAIDVGGGMIYWADFATGVYRAPIDGSGPVAAVYLANWERYTNIALDLVNNHVYFGSPQTGTLWRTDLNGDNFFWGPSNLTGTWGFNGLVIDPAIGKLYFPDTGAIRSANFDGSENQELVTGLSTPLGVALGPDRQRVFYAERGGQSLGVVYTDGTQQQSLITGLGNPFGIAVIRIQAAGSPFDQWIALYFPDEIGDENVTGPSADPAGDGVPNLLKFVLGLDPKTPSRDLLPEAALIDGAFQLTYGREKVATGVDVIVEVSTDLVTWNSGPEHTVMSESDSGETVVVTVHLSSSYSESDRVFVRLRATLED